MSNLTKREIAEIAAAIAPILVDNVKARHHEFWIDPEKHYQSHMQFNRLAGIFDEDMVAALKGMAVSYKKGRKIFASIFLGMVALGALALAFQGWLTDKFK